MKAKMDEIDQIWAVYRRNLGQNSRWNINLPLKINFGRWIKKLGAIWPLDRYITIGITSRPSDQHGRDLGLQIMLHEGGEISPKNWRFISNILAIYHRYFGDICENISPPIFLHEISCQPLPIHDISAIYRRYIPVFSSLTTIHILISKMPNSSNSLVETKWD